MKLSRRDLLTGAGFIVLVPVLIFYGAYGLGDRSFLLISLVILACAMLPFFYLFERRKPHAREIVTIAVMSAIAVAGRAAFYALPQFKPVAAIVIIAGICLGAQSGFFGRSAQRLCFKLFLRPGAGHAVADVRVRHDRIFGRNPVFPEQSEIQPSCALYFRRAVYLCSLRWYCQPWFHGHQRNAADPAVLSGLLRGGRAV